MLRLIVIHIYDKEGFKNEKQNGNKNIFLPIHPRPLVQEINYYPSYKTYFRIVYD